MAETPQHIPSLVEFEDRTKDIVIGAIKLILKRLRKKGAFPDGIEYADLLRDPDQMLAFITCYKHNREIGQDVTLDAHGDPAPDDTTPLVCGLTLAQIERLLVYTCAKKRGVSMARETSDPADAQGAAEVAAAWAQRVAAIKEWLVFDWQLPLIDFYLTQMKPGHFRVLDLTVFLVREAEDLEALASVEPSDLRRVRDLVDTRFEEMMAAHPSAARGLVSCDQQSFDMFAEMTTSRLWEFFGGDPQRVVEVLRLEENRRTVIAPFVADIGMATLRQLEQVPNDMLAPIMTGFTKTFGDEGTRFLQEETFARKFLFTIVGDFLGSDREALADADLTFDKLSEMKWNGIKSAVETWWRTLPN